MKRFLLIIFLIVITCSACTIGGYPSAVYDTLPKQDVLSRDLMPLLQVEHDEGDSLVPFIADARGNVLVDIFLLNVPGKLETMQDLVTGLSIVHNSKTSLVIYQDERTYLNFQEEKLFLDNGSALVRTDSGSILMNIKFLENHFGANVSFVQRRNRHMGVSVRFGNDISVKLQSWGWSTPNLIHLGKVDEFYEQKSGTGYASYTARADLSLTRDADMLEEIVRAFRDNEFTIWERPTGTRVVMRRDEAIVSMMIWPNGYVRINYVNCFPEENV